MEDAAIKAAIAAGLRLKFPRRRLVEEFGAKKSGQVRVRHDRSV